MCKLCVAAGTMTQEQLDAGEVADPGPMPIELSGLLNLIAGRTSDPDGEAQDSMDQAVQDITAVVGDLWEATARIVPPEQDPDAPAMVAARCVWVASRLMFDQKATALASSVVFLVRELTTMREMTEQAAAVDATSTEALAKEVARLQDKLVSLRNKIPSHLKSALGLDGDLWP